MNVISKLPSISKIVLSLLAMITLWLLSGEQDEETTPFKLSRTSDYTMANFTLTMMNDRGKPSRIINGQEMAHYPDDDSTEILFPITQFIEEGQHTWVLSANKASTEGKGDMILFEGNVMITQPTHPDLELHTEALTLNTQNNTAYTDLPVRMKSLNGWTDAVGLHASMAEKTINLHSRVKGRYDVPHAD